MLVGAAIRRRDIESSDDVEPKLKLNPDCLLAETGPFGAKKPPPFACVAPPPLLVSPCCAPAALSTSISAFLSVKALMKLTGLSRSFEANSRITGQRRMYLDDHDWATRRIANYVERVLYLLEERGVVLDSITIYSGARRVCVY
jgi:hypothetical protein